METTTSHYWDCNCDDHYIHSECETWCAVCGAVRDEWHPDAHVSEVEAGENFVKHPLIMKTEIRACTQNEDGEVISEGIAEADAGFFGVYTRHDHGWSAELIADCETLEKAEHFEAGFLAGMKFSAQAARKSANDKQPQTINSLCVKLLKTVFDGTTYESFKADFDKIAGHDDTRREGMIDQLERAGFDWFCPVETLDKALAYFANPEA